MRTAAFTNVWNDMVILEFWAKYYSKYFDDLYVICFGTKDSYNEKLEEFKNKYNLIAIRLPNNEYPREVYTNLNKEKQVELLKNHEWVLYSDCDEIITTNPRKYKDLKDFMKRTTKNWQWCICYEVLQEADEPFLDYSKPILRQRRSWLKNPNLNKVLLSRVPLSWNDGQHQIKETMGMPITTMKDRGLYLLHFKHADYNAPGRDYVPNLRPKFDYVLENFDWRGAIPEELRDVI